MGACSQCGDQTLDEYLVEGRCGACAPQQLDEAISESEQEQITEYSYAKIPIATVNSIGGKQIIATVDVVSAECVFGVNVFRDLFASVRNFVGGRSESYQKVLKNAKETCLSEIRREAFALGANAVVGLQMDYSAISPSGDAGSLVMLVVTGTAVIVENEKIQLPTERHV